MVMSGAFSSKSSTPFFWPPPLGRWQFVWMRHAFTTAENSASLAPIDTVMASTGRVPTRSLSWSICGLSFVPAEGSWPS